MDQEQAESDYRGAYREGAQYHRARVKELRDRIKNAQTDADREYWERQLDEFLED